MENNENARFNYVPCPLCGYERSENRQASETWYCPKCGRSNLGDMDDISKELEKRNRILRKLKDLKKLKPPDPKKQSS